MDFGKLANIEHVDFSLPADISLLDRSPAIDIDVLLGATGWSMPAWKGTIYPPKTPAHRMGYEYSRQFATIEFNTTYYQVPPEERIRKWLEMTTADFVFCPKIYQGISQSASLGIGGSLLPDFLQRMSLFEEKLGLLFMQLPQYFAASKWQALERFAGQWQGGIPLAIELRHPDWFQSHFSSRVASLLADAHISWLITDVSGRRDVSHGFITAPFMCIRFVGTGDEASDLARTTIWARRIWHWRQLGVELVYFFIHSPGNLDPMPVATCFAGEWFKLSNKTLKVPQLYQQDLFG